MSSYDGDFHFSINYCSPWSCFAIGNGTVVNLRGTLEKKYSGTGTKYVLLTGHPRSSLSESTPPKNKSMPINRLY